MSRFQRLGRFVDRRPWWIVAGWAAFPLVANGTALGGEGYVELTGYAPPPAAGRRPGTACRLRERRPGKRAPIKPLDDDGNVPHAGQIRAVWHLFLSAPRS
ncbi:MAG TPA: hypothetical protein VNF73_15475 [Candidatus Saccharimonadales bacterium]|nr:hypothetical protein [Candidatus Saccharimonadales bacterium]